MNYIRRKTIYVIGFVMMLVMISCKNDKKVKTQYQFKYPKSKVWAHKVNDTVVANIKGKIFDGLELDVCFVKSDSTLYVGHEMVDSVNKLTLQMWFSAMDNPRKNNYWLDVKNLNVENVQPIAKQILDIIKRYKLNGKIIVESYNKKPLKLFKQFGIPVSLWVENVYYWKNWDENPKGWYKSTKNEIDYVNPDAISCEYRMYELLTKYFPEQNIHLWQTPMKYNEKNVELTRKMCRNKSVKVVLVDYDEPVNY